MKLKAFALIFFCYCAVSAQTVEDKPKSDTVRLRAKAPVSTKALYGIASFYADKFEGRKAADGSIYYHKNATCACNVLPLGTWVRVTNVRNRKSVIVKVTDRLHPKNPRIVDMSKSTAAKLGFVGRGITQVKVEVLGKKKPASGVE